MRENELQDEILSQVQLLNCLRKWISIISNTIPLIGKYELVVSPSIYGIECIYDKILDDREQTRKIAKKWIQNVPFVFSGGYFKKEEAEQGRGKVHMFFCAEEDDLKFLPLKIDERITHFPSYYSVHTAFVSDDVLNAEVLLPAFHYLKAHGLQLRGNILIRTITSTKKHGKHEVVYDAWLPIE